MSGSLLRRVNKPLMYDRPLKTWSRHKVRTIIRMCNRMLTSSSTYDGVAIAYATLSPLAGIGCNTLFVTHYPIVAEELAKEVSF